MRTKRQKSLKSRLEEEMVTTPMPSQDLKGKLLITFEDSLILTSLNFLWKEVLERLSALVGERAINLHILRWHSHKKDPLALLPSQIDRID